MSHKELTEIAKKWLKSKARCGVSYSEIRTLNSSGEIPDAIGFKASGISVIVECKTSRSDFIADAKKRFREDGTGMGDFRFYICPEKVILPEDVPKNWGLIWVDSKGKSRTVVNPYCRSLDGNIWHGGFDKNFKAEHCFMYSILRRSSVDAEKRYSLLCFLKEKESNNDPSIEIHNTFNDKLKFIVSKDLVTYDERKGLTIIKHTFK